MRGPTIRAWASAQRFFEGLRGDGLERQGEDVTVGADAFEGPGQIGLGRNAQGATGGDDAKEDARAVRALGAAGEEHVEAQLRDVLELELGAGLLLGLLLAAIGFARILLWQVAFHSYGEHYMKVALTVSLSLIGVVTWGTLSGSLLPFVLRRLGFDPASASAPFVATMVDVAGLVIYFSVAQVVLSGTLL